MYTPCSCIFKRTHLIGKRDRWYKCVFTCVCIYINHSHPKNILFIYMLVVTLLMGLCLSIFCGNYMWLLHSHLIFRYIYISTATYIHTSCKYFRYGGFLKQGYPQIIHFKKLFPYKPPILGYPHLWTPPNPFGTTPSYSPNAKAAGSANACVKRSRCHCRVEEDWGSLMCSCWCGTYAHLLT